MSTSKRESPRTAGSVLIVGVGGLGCPAALALARAGVERLVLCDDDAVDVTNLHRQVLFSPSDVGRDKLDAALATLARVAPDVRVDVIRSRLLPENARELARSVDVVVEGADNFATKFLAADACHLEDRPVVHGSAIRWRATVWAIPPRGRPCYRCLFEDVPGGHAQPNCAEAGVMGPVVGLAGALMADLCLDLLTGHTDRLGRIYTYDGLGDHLRAVPVTARSTCPLCGDAPQISDIHESRYVREHCAA
jgi:molybdopterin/thiamine biosynthesis adenylyltransferase